MPGKNVLSFDNVADLEASNVPSDVYAIILLGYYIIGDAPAVTYTRWTNAAPPAPLPLPKSGRLKSADDKWWEISPPSDYLDVRWFGAKMTVDAEGQPIDDRENLQKAIDCALGPPLPIRAEKVRTVFIPEGTLFVADTVFLRGVTLLGTGPMRSFITLTKSNGVCIKMDGGSGFSPTRAETGGGLQSISIWMLEGLTGFMGVHVVGDEKFQADEAVFEDIKISGGGTWSYPMYLDGSKRVQTRNSEGKPVGLSGLRKVTIRNVFLGNGLNFSLVALGVGDLSIYNAGCFPFADGTISTRADVLIAGDPGISAVPGTATTLAVPEKLPLPCIAVHLTACNLQGTVWLYYTEAASISGKVKSMICSTGAKGCALYGTLLPGSGGVFFTYPEMGNEKYVATL